MKTSPKALVASLVVLSVVALASESMAKSPFGSSSRKSFSKGVSSFRRSTSFSQPSKKSSGSFHRKITQQSSHVFKAKPKFPTTMKPRLPQINKPRLPQINKPRLPQVGKPKLPQIGKPRLPQLGKPRLPQIGKPRLPQVGKPRIPQIGKPKFPHVGKPKLPHFGKPHFPGIHKPHHPHGPKHHWGRPKCYPRIDWCHRRPVHCHWWYDYCRPIRHCAPRECVSYCYDYVAVVDTHWYLGMKCSLLPGKGIGVTTVEAGSPAALAGLAPGMVITRANDVDLLEDGAMKSVIANSGGTLNMTVLTTADAEPANVSVAMKQMVSQNF